MLQPSLPLSTVSKPLPMSEVTSKNDDSELPLLLDNIAQQACKVSYERLFKSISPRLLSYARKQGLEDAMCMELVQETMLKLWLKAGLYTPSKGAAINWIFSVARNVKFDLFRRNKHSQEWIQGDDLWPILAEPEPDHGQVSAEVSSLVKNELEQVLSTLPSEQADIVRRVYLHGESQQDVSNSLGIALGTVKSRLRLALKKMKEVLDDDD